MSQLSVDFRSSEIRLLETEGNPKGLKLKNFRLIRANRDSADLIQDDEAAKSLGDAMGRVLSKERFPRDPACMALGSSYCFFRDIDLPFKGDEQIRKVIKFEVESSIQIDIDDVVISYFKKTESLDKSNLMVVGARKDILGKQLQLMEACDVDPFFIDLDLLCIFNALSATGVLKETDRLLLVNVTTEATHILVLHKERMISGRAIPLGVEGMLRSFKHELKMARLDLQDSLEDALGITSPGDLALDLVLEGEVSEEESDLAGSRSAVRGNAKEVRDIAEQIRNGFLNKLRREMIRTLTFLSAEERPEKIFLTGRGCTLPGLDGLLNELYDSQVEELDLLSRVDHGFNGDTASKINREICVPLGAAYKLAGFDATRFDLRQEELRYAKKFDQVKVPLACLAFLVLILVVLLNLEQFMLRKARQWEMDQVTARSTLALKTALEDPELAESVVNRYDDGLTRVNGIKRAMEDKNKALGDQLGREGTIPELPSAFPVWHQFFAVIEEHHEEFELFRLKQMDVKMLQKIPVLTFDCEIASGQDASKLESCLEEVPIFSRITLGASKVSGEVRELEGTRIEIDLTKEIASK